MPRKPAASKKPAVTKIFVLDTNVLMHDPSSLFRFEEHDVFLPIMTLEELDNHKKGMSEIARNARQTSRMLDELLADDSEAMELGISLYEASSKMASGRLFLQRGLRIERYGETLGVGKQRLDEVYARALKITEKR